MTRPQKMRVLSTWLRLIFMSDTEVERRLRLRRSAKPPPERDVCYMLDHFEIIVRHMPIEVARDLRRIAGRVQALRDQLDAAVRDAD
jgi:hypothetical protein